MKKIICIVLVFSLVFSFSVSAFATTVTSVTIPDLKTGWSISSSGSVTSPSGYSGSWFTRVLDQVVKSNLALGDKGDNYIDQTIFGYVHSLYDDLHRIENGLNGSSNTSVASRLSSFYTFLSSISSNVGYIDTDVGYIRTDVGYIESYVDSIKSDIHTISTSVPSDFDTFLNRLGIPSTGNSVFSYLVALTNSNARIMSSVEHLEYVLADDDDKALKDDSKDTQLKAQDEFFGDGANAVSSDNLGSLSGLVSAFRSFLGDDIGLGSLNLAGWEQIVTSDDSWSFFTDGDQIAEDMGVTASGISSPDFSNPDTPGSTDYVNLITRYPGSFDVNLSSSSENRGEPYSFLDYYSSGYIPFPYNSALLYFYFPASASSSLSSFRFFVFTDKDLYGSSNVNSVNFNTALTNSNLLVVNDDFFILRNIWSNRNFFRFTCPSSFVSDGLIVTDSPIPNRSPSLVMLASNSPLPLSFSSFDDSNVVVTSYYEDNKNALWGWLH